MGRKSSYNEKISPTIASTTVSTIIAIAMSIIRIMPDSLFIDKLMQRQIVKVANAVITGGVMMDLFNCYDSLDLE